MEHATKNDWIETKKISLDEYFAEGRKDFLDYFLVKIKYLLFNFVIELVFAQNPSEILCYIITPMPILRIVGVC